MTTILSRLGFFLLKNYYPNGDTIAKIVKHLGDNDTLCCIIMYHFSCVNYWLF